MFAAIWSDTMHAFDNPTSWMTLRQGKMLKEWAKQYDNVYMYNYIYYMLAGCGAPIPLAHKHMHDMPLYKKWGVVGFFDEGRTVRGETGIFPTYLRARMMWDANLDVQEGDGRVLRQLVRPRRRTGDGLLGRPGEHLRDHAVARARGPHPALCLLAGADRPLEKDI